LLGQETFVKDMTINIEFLPINFVALHFLTIFRLSLEMGRLCDLLKEIIPCIYIEE